MSVARGAGRCIDNFNNTCRKTRVKLVSKEEDVKETMVSKTVRLFTGSCVCLLWWLVVIIVNTADRAGPDINKEVPDVDDSLLSKAGIRGVREQRQRRWLGMLRIS